MRLIFINRIHFAEYCGIDRLRLGVFDRGTNLWIENLYTCCKNTRITIKTVHSV